MDLVGLIREVAPALGDAGDGFHGADTPPRRRAWTGGGAGRLELLLDAASQLRGLLPMIDPNVSTKLDERSGQFAAVRHELDRVVEEQLAAPLESRGYLRSTPECCSRFRSRRPVLRDARYYPLFDQRMAELVGAAVQDRPTFWSAGGSGTADAACTSRSHKRNGVVNLTALAALRARAVSTRLRSARVTRRPSRRWCR